jgi:hypothetical protein
MVARINGVLLDLKISQPLDGRARAGDGVGSFVVGHHDHHVVETMYCTEPGTAEGQYRLLALSRTCQ